MPLTSQQPFNRFLFPFGYNVTVTEVNLEIIILKIQQHLGSDVEGVVSEKENVKIGKIKVYYPGRRSLSMLPELSVFHLIFLASHNQTVP